MCVVRALSKQPKSKAKPIGSIARTPRPLATRNPHTRSNAGSPARDTIPDSSHSNHLPNTYKTKYP